MKKTIIALAIGMMSLSAPSANAQATGAGSIPAALGGTALGAGGIAAIIVTLITLGVIVGNDDDAVSTTTTTN